MIQEIQFNIDGESYTIGVEAQLSKSGDSYAGARMVKSLLMTQDLDDFRVKLWNQGIDLIESGIIVYIVSGGIITNDAFMEMIKCQVTMLKRRLGL